MSEPVVLTIDQHPIRAEHISPQAMKVLDRLRTQGYLAYLAGGCVRDLLLGRTPKDFDVVTNATPRQVKRSFRNSRMIGRRFRLVHVFFYDETIEVSTFRSPVDDTEGTADEDGHLLNADGLVLRDNVFGSPEEDALRRDFTINALFLDSEDFSIIDYAGALPDIEARRIHCIGQPDVRYTEDPVRMLRAARFASTLDLDMEEETRAAIDRNREHLAQASPARLYEEVQKFFHSGASEKAYRQLQNTGLLATLFPNWSNWLEGPAAEGEKEWVVKVFQQMDRWKEHGHMAEPALLFGLLFGSYHQYLAQQATAPAPPGPTELAEAIRGHHSSLRARVQIPARALDRLVNIELAQARFQEGPGKKAGKFTRTYFFRDALIYYKFACLRSGQDEDNLAAWQEVLRNAPPPDPEPIRMRPRRRRRPRRSP